jgi:hypothetical protein
MHWDNTNGAGISGDAAESVWKAYIAQRVRQLVSRLCASTNIYIYKSNSAMKPFRNAGWAYYDQMQAIFPSGGAKGTHAFVPTSSATFDDAEEIDEDLAKVASGSGGAGDKDAAAMVVDDVLQTASTASGSKRKLSVLDDGPPLTHLSSPSIPSLPKKRKSSSKMTTSSAMVSSGVADKASSRRVAGKITSAVAINNMQGSINRLTDALTDAMEKSSTASQNPTMKLRTEAVKLLQDRDDDGLTQQEQLDMLTLFMTNKAAVGTYLALEKGELRVAWMRKMLREMQGE